MMNLDKDCLDKENIQSAIDYLFPSGLFDKHARPQMCDPDCIYDDAAATNVVDIDLSGRPDNVFYYTGSPKFYDSLNVIFLILL